MSILNEINRAYNAAVVQFGAVPKTLTVTPEIEYQIFKEARQFMLIEDSDVKDSEYKGMKIIVDCTIPPGTFLVG